MYSGGGIPAGSRLHDSDGPITALQEQHNHNQMIKLPAVNLEIWQA